jgi:hypothetical protein
VARHKFGNEANNGLVWLRFSGPQLSGNNDFFENPLSGKSGVWKIEVFGNPDYFHCILCLSCKTTCTPLRLVITHFHSFFLPNTIVDILSVIEIL